MLNILNAIRKIGSHWGAPQQPVHDNNAYMVDYVLLLAALEQGWQIIEAGEILAHGANAEAHGYVLTLMHPYRLLTCEWNVERSPEVDALLAHLAVPRAR